MEEEETCLAAVEDSSRPACTGMASCLTFFRQGGGVGEGVARPIRTGLCGTGTILGTSGSGIVPIRGALGGIMLEKSMKVWEERTI